LNKRPPNNHEGIWKPTHLEDLANLHLQGDLWNPDREERSRHVHLLGPADTQCNETLLQRRWRQITGSQWNMRFHGGDHEDYSLMGCDTVLFGTLIPTFQCNLLPLFSRKNSSLSTFDDTHTHAVCRCTSYEQDITHRDGVLLGL
jgi:hypothetical protein